MVATTTAQEAENEFYHHEVLHVAYIIGDLWDEHILDAPFVAASPELTAEAEDISERLANFYQRVGLSIPTLARTKR